MAITPSEFKAAMGSFAAGVTVVTTVDGAGQPHGLTATAFTSVSLDPPLCLVCVDHRAASLGALRDSGVLAVSMLGASQQALSARFSTRSADKFATVAFSRGVATGCPLLDGAVAHVEGRVVDIHDAGDHAIVIAELIRVEVAPAGEGPLLYFRGRYADLEPRDA